MTHMCRTSPVSATTRSASPGARERSDPARRVGILGASSRSPRPETRRLPPWARDAPPPKASRGRGVGLSRTHRQPRPGLPGRDWISIIQTRRSHVGNPSDIPQLMAAQEALRYISAHGWWRGHSARGIAAHGCGGGTLSGQACLIADLPPVTTSPENGYMKRRERFDPALEHP